jgi:tRNA pseudouridine38-40 synthase
MVPKMPALGLLLESPVFDSYNIHKLAGVNEGLKPTDADYRPPIDFSIHQDKIDKFKEDFIYSKMRMIEDRDAT